MIPWIIGSLDHRFQVKKTKKVSIKIGEDIFLVIKSIVRDYFNHDKRISNDIALRLLINRLVMGDKILDYKALKIDEILAELKKEAIEVK